MIQWGRYEQEQIQYLIYSGAQGCQFLWVPFIERYRPGQTQGLTGPPLQGRGAQTSPHLESAAQGLALCLFNVTFLLPFCFPEFYWCECCATHDLFPLQCFISSLLQPFSSVLACVGQFPNPGPVVQSQNALSEELCLFSIGFPLW